ncbi:MAG TPA: hypothetical protein VHM25_08270, partial [Polyangiaceae bacterium]|nr:hypothetical protein [Polyangiaceae bacterium]
MASARLLSLLALGMGAFSSCSAGEIARPAPDRGAAASAPIATLTIPVPPVVPARPAEPAPEVTAEPASVPVLAVAAGADTAEAEPAPNPDSPSDDDEEDEAAPSSQRELEPIVDPSHLLVAIGRETLVYERPSFKSQKIGYLRAGAQVRRDEKPAGFDGCKLGFYRIMPEGYVCVGPTATLDP